MIRYSLSSCQEKQTCGRMSNMEFTVASKNILKAKGKTSSVLLCYSREDLEAVSKATEADAVVLLEGKAFVVDNSKLQNSRLVVSGAGEYEIGGIKITGYTSANGYAYFVTIDGVEVFVGTAKTSGSLDKKKEVDIAVFFCDATVKEGFVTDLAPSYLVLYGEKAGEAAKEFGKESVTSVSKLATVKEKLPEEMETVVLS